MAAVVDQKTYLLNKYLKAPSADKKKKKRKHVKGTGLRIIDDDVDTSRLRPLEPDELEALGEGEDAPQIAGIVDERPEEVRKMEQFTTSTKWRVIAQDDGFDSKIRVEEIKKNMKKIEEDEHPMFGKMYSDSEDEKKNDSDLSPPRKSAKAKTASHIDKSKNKQIHHDSDGDLSPPRNKSQNRSDSDQSPPRKTDKIRRKVDRSPQRRKSSPSRNRRNSTDSDLSPPRKKEALKSKERPKKPSRWGHFGPEETNIKPTHDSDQSPPRKTKPSDISDRNAKRDYKPARDREQSPQRKSRKSSPRRKHGSDSDLSPPRKTANPKKGDRSIEPDLSPPRRSRKDHRSPERLKSSNRVPDERPGSYKSRAGNFDGRRDGGDRNYERNEGNRERQKERYGTVRSSDSPPPSNKKMAKTLEGKTAGLQDARELRKENDEFRKKEDELYSKMSADVSGRNATTANRRLGKRETSAEKEKKREDQEKQKVLEEKYNKWGKGLKQTAEQEARVQDYLHEASKPLARHRDDADLERSLRDQDRAGDPMLEYMREKRGDDVRAPERPSYKGNWPPNRFNIPPGYRWDGVDRSNGYEKKYFDQKSKAKALEEEAYKWSTEDL